MNLKNNNKIRIPVVSFHKYLNKFKIIMKNNLIGKIILIIANKLIIIVIITVN
jgi:hypothetical protein